MGCWIFKVDNCCTYGFLRSLLPGLLNATTLCPLHLIHECSTTSYQKPRLIFPLESEFFGTAQAGLVHTRIELLDGDGFREVARLIYVTAPADGDVVSQQLQRHNLKQWREQFDGWGKREDMVGGLTG